MIQSIENGRKEDGNRSIADKIINRLHDLELTVENNHGRWAWELLQNAKDSVANIDRKISVEIELNANSVKFRHNGMHFTEKDIRGLINQISSKEAEEGTQSKLTGKFGTGFLTTHLLTKIIEVEGIVETIDEEYYNFSFSLDRSGKTTPQLIIQIENAWKAFHTSTEGNKIDDYNKEEFNTLFTYNLTTNEQKEIAKIGVIEFTQLIPFVLAFNLSIDSVKIIDNLTRTKIEFQNSDSYLNDIIVNITKIENEEKSDILILLAEGEDVAIAAIVKPFESGYEIQSLNNYPKLFCDFPLIGTEDFHFPVIVNSFYFNPLMEREGIWLKGDGKKEVDENKEILKKAVQLYKALLGKITELKFYGFYNICLSEIPATNEKYFDKEWYKNDIQSELRKLILISKVVEIEDDALCKNIRFPVGEVYFPDPDLNNSYREQIWDFSSALKVNKLPAKRLIHKWAKLIWKDDCSILNVSDLVIDVKGQSNIASLIKTLEKTESQTFDWLNKCINFIYEIEKSPILFNNNEIIPNQKGDFKKRDMLSTDKINDEILKEIALLLGYNYYEKLIHNEILFEDSYSKITIQDIATKISKLITSGEDNDDDRKFAIRKLCQWFDQNEENGREYFKDIYSNKEKYFVQTIDDKENLYRVLTSKTSLLDLAEIAAAVENDPEILNIIEKRKREKEEENDRNIVGEKVEKILAEALEHYGFKVKKEIYGKDLVIALKKDEAKYFVEVKSTSMRSHVSMTPFQAKTAVDEAFHYALCVVEKNGSTVNKEYIRNNAKFVVNIGDKLRHKVEKVKEFEISKNKIANTNEAIDLVYENNLEYKYKINRNIWINSKSFLEFIEYINEDDVC